MGIDNRHPAVRILTGQAADAAKQAARDAVAGYHTLNPYTIGVAVEAALKVVTSPALMMMTATAVTTPMRTTQTGPVIDARATDVTHRARLLEAVVSAARNQHPREHDAAGSGCGLCAALDQLDATG